MGKSFVMSRRISPATLLLAIFAVLFGLLGAYAVQQQYAKQPAVEPVAAAPQPPVIVPMASTDLKAGRRITLGDVALVSVTRDQMRAQGISESYMSSPQQIIGRVLRDDLEKGKTFSATALYPEGTGPGVADMLDPGQRAVTVPVAIDEAVAGFAMPGVWVDVLFRSEGDQEREHPETTVTLIERVKVLAFNQETLEGARSAQEGRRRTTDAAVTLSVSPEQAAALRVVDARGALSLALRHPDDMDSFATGAPRTLDELLNIPPADRHRMEIYRGNRLTEVEFERGEKSAEEQVVASSNQTAAVAPNPKN